MPIPLIVAAVAGVVTAGAAVGTLVYTSSDKGATCRSDIEADGAKTFHQEPFNTGAFNCNAPISGAKGSTTTASLIVLDPFFRPQQIGDNTITPTPSGLKGSSASGKGIIRIDNKSEYSYVAPTGLLTTLTSISAYVDYTASGSITLSGSTPDQELGGFGSSGFTVYSPFYLDSDIVAESGSVSASIVDEILGPPKLSGILGDPSKCAVSSSSSNINYTCNFRIVGSAVENPFNKVILAERYETNTSGSLAEVPAPLPILGFGTFLANSRRLRGLSAYLR